MEKGRNERRGSNQFPSLARLFMSVIHRAFCFLRCLEYIFFPLHFLHDNNKFEWSGVQAAFVASQLQSSPF